MSDTQTIEAQILQLEPWKQELMNQLRDLVRQTDPNLLEQLKWGTGVWVYNKKLVCAVSAFKDHVKINFFNGSQLIDSNNLFNNGLESKAHRSIDIFKDGKVNKAAVLDLIKQSVKLLS